MKTQTLRTSLPLLLIILGLAGCTDSATKPPEKASAPLAVKTTLPKRGDITRGIVLPGNVAANQQAALYAKVGGYLKTIRVDKGDAVKEGDLLAEIEVPELLADAARYKAEMEVAEIDYQRTVEAQKKAPDLVVAQAVDAARAKFDVARANQDHAQTLLSFCRITAPFSGVVTRRSVDPGAFIPAATSGSASATPALLTIMDSAIVRVQVAVPEPETPFIRNGLPVKLTIEELPGRVFNGTVTRYSHSLDEASKTMLVEIDLPNSDGRLLLGMYAIVKLGVETRTNALLVEKAGSSVFKVTAGKAVKIPVKTGFNDGANVEILDALDASTPLILVGKQTLAGGQAVSITETK